MSGINTISESIKKKLTLKDYKPAILQDIDTLEHFEDDTASCLGGENASQLKGVEAYTSKQNEQAIIDREEVKTLKSQSS